jgi:ubiquinone/menaquinone biosynthesis C-methylase UbiE
VLNVATRSTALELIDGPVDSPRELEESFRDIALINRRFGGTAVVRFALRDLEPRSLLDVCAGVADIPKAIAASAHRRSKALSVTCLDSNETLLELSRERHAGDPAITFVCGDATKLPFHDGAFDVAMCNLAMHHFDPDAAVALLRELRRVSRLTPIVTDLSRSQLTLLAAWTFSRLFTRNRLTRNDAPLSARRAYTSDEALVLARAAGWRAPRTEPFRFIRMVLRDDATL